MLTNSAIVCQIKESVFAPGELEYLNFFEDFLLFLEVLESLGAGGICIANMYH